MNVRGTLATTTALFALLAVVPAAAVESYSLDGKRTKIRRYEGELTEATVPSSSVLDPLTPVLADCTASSCDQRELRLALPRGTQNGRFRAVVIVDASLSAALVLVDGTGRIVQMDEPVDREDPSGEPPTPGEGTTYILELSDGRLAAGRYTLALVDRAGVGTFDATVEWIAHPPPRHSR